MQNRMFFGDEAVAQEFWKDKEWKTYAVDLVTGSGKHRKVIHTMYVKAKTPERAKANAKENDIARKPKPFYYPRLAGPLELGCTAIKSASMPGFNE